MVPMLHDVKAGFFLVAVLAMLVFICAITGLGALLRPVRWSERKVYR